MLTRVRARTENKFGPECLKAFVIALQAMKGLESLHLDCTLSVCYMVSLPHSLSHHGVYRDGGPTSNDMYQTHSLTLSASLSLSLSLSLPCTAPAFSLTLA